MTDIMSILQSSYTTGTQNLIPTGSKFAKVDPTQFQGNWTGKDADGKAISLKLSDISGYRANANLNSTTTGTEQARVFINTKNTFRIGDSSFYLTGKGTGLLATVVTDPNTGIQTIQKANLTLSTT
jgi:hypothetical protein